MNGRFVFYSKRFSIKTRIGVDDVSRPNQKMTPRPPPSLCVCVCVCVSLCHGIRFRVESREDEGKEWADRF